MDENQLETSDAQLSSENPDAKLSKNQQKKLKKRLKWLETKTERRLAEKQKKKQRRAERRERGEELGPSRKLLKLNTMSNSSCKIKVALDLSLDEYMSDKDIASLTLQIQHSYSSNRRAENPMQLYACSLGGRTQQRLDGIGDYKSWDIHFKEESYLDAFPKESIVYLSSESSNVLTSLSEDKVYIIGGLVDHNAHKGLCHRLAEEKGVSHAQLPISDFLHLKSRKVLAVNHVVSILLRFTETSDWKQAFLSELPKRKGFSPVANEEAQETSRTDLEKESDGSSVSDDDNGDDESEPQLSCDNTSTPVTVPGDTGSHENDKLNHSKEEKADNSNSDACLKKDDVAEINENVKE